MPLSTLAPTLSAFPQTLVNRTLSLAEFVAGKIERVADGLSGNNSNNDDDDNDDTITFMVLKTHFEMMEKLRKTKPTNYKNLVRIALKLTQNKDKESRNLAILKAFQNIPPPEGFRTA